MKGQKKLSFHARRILEQQEQQQHANAGPTCSTSTAPTAALLPTICTLAREQYMDGLREGHSELPSTFNHVHSVPQQPTARQAVGTKRPWQRMTAAHPVAIAAARLRKPIKQQRRPSGKEHFDVAPVAPAGTAAVGTSAAAAAGAGDGSAAPPAKRARATVLQAQQEPSAAAAAAAAGAVSADAGLATGADSAPAQPPRSCVHRSSSPDSPAQSGPARANTNGKRYVATIDGG